MIPVQLIRVGLGDEAIQVPVFRLPYVGGQDAFASPGGFFTTKSGEYGIVVDMSLSGDDASAFAAAEIKKNLPVLTRLVEEQVDSLKKQQNLHMS